MKTKTSSYVLKYKSTNMFAAGQGRANSFCGGPESEHGGPWCLRQPPSAGDGTEWGGPSHETLFVDTGAGPDLSRQAAVC